METISLQCNGLSQIHSSVYFRLKIVRQNLKKYFRGSWELPQAHEKVCDENETNKQRKKRRPSKIFFDGRKEFIRRVRKTRAMDIK